MIQNHKPPSFFHTNTTVLHQAIWLGLMASDSNISCRWFLTSSTNGGGIHLNCSLKAVSSVTFIVCSMEWVQPNSTASNKNTSWYLAKSWHAASASSGVQETRPHKSNSSNNLPCLCLTVSPRVYGNHGTHWPPLAIAHPQGVQAQVMQLPPWPPVFSFGWSASMWCYSLHPQLLFYCLSLTWCTCYAQ